VAIYKYKCNNCGRTLEKIQAIPRQPGDVEKCPSCRSRMEYVYSAPGLNLKGGGWSKGYAGWGDQK